MSNILESYKNKITMVSLQGLASGSNFLLVVLLTRLYGIEVFGIYSMIWLVLVFMLSLQQSLILSPLLTLWAKNNNRHTWNGFFQLNLVVAALLSVAAAVFAKWAHLIANKWVIEDYSPVVGLLVLASLLHLFNRRSLINMGYVGFVFLVDVTAYVMPLLIILIFQPVLFHVVLFQASFVGLAVILGIIKLRPSFVSFKQLIPVAVMIWKFSSWLLLTGILQWFSGNFFVVATGAIMGASALGVIRLGQSAIGLFNVFFIAMENRVPFSSAKIFSVVGKDALKKYLLDIFKKGAGLTIMAILLFSLGSKQIVALLYGSKYVSYFWILILFAGLQFFVFLNTLFQIVFRTIEQTKVIFFTYIVTTVVSVISAFPLVQLWGIKGAVLGIFITQLVSIAVYSVTLKVQWKKI